MRASLALLALSLTGALAADKDKGATTPVTDMIEKVTPTTGQENERSVR